MIKRKENIISGSLYYISIFKRFLGSRIYIIFALTLFAAISEGIGFTLIMPLFQDINIGDGQEPSGIRALLNNFLTFFGWQNSTEALIILIGVAFIFKGLLLFLATGYNAYLSGVLLGELKSKIFKKYSLMSYEYYSQRDTGHYINIINTQINIMLKSFEALTQMLSQVVLALAYTIMAFLITFSFGLTSVIIGIFIILVFRKLNVFLAKLSKKSSFETGIQSKIMIQYLHSFKYLSSTSQSHVLEKIFKTSLDRLINFFIKRGIIAAFTQSTREPFVVLAVCFIMFIYLTLFNEPLGPLVVSIMLFYRAINSVYTIQKQWQHTLDRSGGVIMVLEEFDLLDKNRDKDGTDNISIFSKNIEIKNVSFSYGDSDRKVINNININILANTSIAIIGKSGSGKSTLIDLITLILKPDSGEILIDGKSSGSINTKFWKEQIGVVSQDAVIFDDTIANNISMWSGNADNDKDLMSRIKLAAKQAFLDEFIEGLDQKYNTEVGDRGIRLSGGQKQRLFIARELFRSPKVLILDEATSALDSNSEEAIKKSIDLLKGKITVIIIAHRLSTIKNVDHVYVIDEGVVIEDGGYDALRSDSNSELSKSIRKQSL